MQKYSQYLFSCALGNKQWKIWGDPCTKSARQGPFMVQIGQFFLDLKTMNKLEFTAWFEVNPTFGSRGLKAFEDFGGKFAPPPSPRLISVNAIQMTPSF